MQAQIIIMPDLLTGVRTTRETTKISNYKWDDIVDGDGSPHQENVVVT
jgi:hypothetical protein